MAIKIITTEDGSHSLFDEEMNETYHSTRGARGESLHVFIREGLEYFHQSNASKEINILEVGLGTGLNALLSALYAEENKIEIAFTSLEPFPIHSAIYEKLNYHRTDQEKALFMRIHESEWENQIEISSGLSLFKTTSRLEVFQTSKHFSLIYFDAFAPGKQAEVWELDNLRKCYNLLEPGGILTTYCSQGQFKRNLAETGFKVETLQGAMGKKEMVRAVKS
ncbi:MAG: tRNA (5-methylaminomethyl-2-thiouridine)(34)-methyltransferase MnmD [Cyclobacteriaceae bacterium]